MKRGRPEGKNLKYELKTLANQGYIRASPAVRRHIRTQLLSDFKYIHLKSSLFGENTSFIFNIKKSNKFIDMLTEKFNSAFPYPTTQQVRKLTSDLHAYSLH